MAFSIFYKGYEIVYDNGIYYLRLNPYKKYLSLSYCLIQINLLTKKIW